MQEAVVRAGIHYIGARLFVCDELCIGLLAVVFGRCTTAQIIPRAIVLVVIRISDPGWAAVDDVAQYTLAFTEQADAGGNLLLATVAFQEVEPLLTIRVGFGGCF